MPTLNHRDSLLSPHTRGRTTDILDSALLRAGRIDRKIEFPPPGPEARVAILRIHSRKVRMAEYIEESDC
jgi:ATP-dependent 26S proteasome regulatory subunit